MQTTHPPGAMPIDLSSQFKAQCSVTSAQMVSQCHSPTLSVQGIRSVSSLNMLCQSICAPGILVSETTFGIYERTSPHTQDTHTHIHTHARAFLVLSIVYLVFSHIIRGARTICPVQIANFACFASTKIPIEPTRAYQSLKPVLQPVKGRHSYSMCGNTYGHPGVKEVN